ncbi:WD40/YVTN/BNR-like repeat-containing protein [Bdellovibrio bacteriovorus]|uniref:WD40/YVTN/BNR-like repeat-containing protein n=1 Tax=Bdellovibrio bacteriovorus TaxID=959 RepID=UPI0035A5D9EC
MNLIRSSILTASLFLSSFCWAAWQTAEQITNTQSLGSSWAQSVTVTTEAVLAVGFMAVENGWTVRRSLDAGRTWETVGRLPEGYKNARALSIVSDNNDTIYVYGVVGEAPGHQNPFTIIRRSKDNGTTWTTVLEQDGATAVDERFKRVAVDWNGIVYAIVDNHQVLRSSDEGATWRTVDTFPGFAYSVVAGKFIGGVVVVGASAATLPQIPEWRVRYAVNGVDDWRTVDSFRSDTGGEGIAIPYSGCFSVKGKIAVVGTVLTPANVSRWQVRLANVASPDQWKTIDSFVPTNGADSFGSQRANDCAFNLQEEVFVTGRSLENQNGALVPFYLTRKASLESKNTTFKNSDKIANNALSGGLQVGGWGVAVNGCGDVFTAGEVRDLAQPTLSDWLVRVLYAQEPCGKNKPTGN